MRDDEPVGNHPTARDRVRDSTGPIVLVATYALALALFGTFAVTGDGTFYYDLTRRIVGDGGVVYAYQWGTSVWNAPFYVIGHAVGLPYDVPIGHADGRTFRDASIGVGGSVAALGSVIVSWAAVRRLGLPSGTVPLLGAMFGTELWYYGLADPSYTHALDSLAFSTACYLVLRVWQAGPPVFAVLLGASLSALASIRYANFAAAPGLVLPIVMMRDVRAGLRVFTGALVAGALLLAVPLALGARLGGTADVRLQAAGTNPALPVAQPSLHALTSHLLAPVEMLLSPERGLFAYAPLCALGLVGFVLAALRPSSDRAPLIGIGVAAVGILGFYAIFADVWKGGTYAYGQRFLTSLTVVILIGVAELVRRKGRWAVAAVVACTVWSLFIGLNFLYGWSGVSNDHRNADDIVRLYTSGERTVPGFVQLVGYRLRSRFTG